MGAADPTRISDRYLHTVLIQDRADRLDPVTGRPHLVDETADRRWRESSSRAKNIEAAFRISLASLRSRTSRSSARMRCASAVVTP